MWKQTKTAMISAWLIISVILLLLFLALYLLSENTILSASETFQLQHHGPKPCALCGMTSAFIAISQDNLNEALNVNSWSVVLYRVLLANELLAAIFLLGRIYKGF